MTNKAWGSTNPSGILGTGDTLTHATPTDLAGGVSFVQIEHGGTSSVGRTADGSVYVWGSNLSGQLGAGSTDSSSHSTPTQLVDTLLTNIVRVQMTAGTGLALDGSGNLVGWGDNSGGTLATGDFTTPKTPTLIATGVADFFGGANGSLILLTSTGVVKTAGSNNHGQLGINSSDTSTFNTLQTATPASGTPVAVFSGAATSWILMADGSVVGAGRSDRGELGNTNLNNINWVNTPLTNVVRGGCGANSFFAVLDDDTAWVLGVNVGTGSSTPSNSSTPLAMNWPSGVLPLYYGRGNFGSTARGALGSDHLVYITLTSVTVDSNVVYATWFGGDGNFKFADLLSSAPVGRAGRAWAAVIG